MFNISNNDITSEPSKKEWVVRFLNLPSTQQVDFLYRSHLAEEVRLEIEELVLRKNDQENSK